MENQAVVQDETGKSVPFLHKCDSRREIMIRRHSLNSLVFAAIVLFLGSCVETQKSSVYETDRTSTATETKKTTSQTALDIPAPTSSKASLAASESSEPVGVWHKDITGTYFDIAEYPTPQTAWNDMDALDENPFYLALPFNDRVPGFREYGSCKNRWVEVVVVSTGQRGFGQWEDVGPWFVNDVNYVFDSTGKTRPFSELHEGEYWNIYCGDQGSGVRKPRRILNSAGIDLSPALANAIGLGGKNQVNWRFVDASQVADGPWKDKISESKPHYRQRFYFLFGLSYRSWELTTTRYLR